MYRTAGLTISLVLLTGLGGVNAWAQTTVAVLGVEPVEAPANRAICLAEALKSQVKQAQGFALVPGKDIDEIKLVFGCIDEKPACMARAGKSLRASKLLWGTLRKGPAGYTFAVRLLDVATAKIDKQVTETVSKASLGSDCGAAATARVAAAMFAKAKGAIKVSANVAGAQVLLGPTVIGMTYDMPIVLKDLPAGSYEIHVRKDGYDTWSKTVTITSGQVLELQAELTEVRGPTPPTGGDDTTSGGRTGWKIAFWSSAAITVGMAVGLGVSGAGVLGVQEDKEDFIIGYRDFLAKPDNAGKYSGNPYHALDDNTDVCTNSDSIVDSGYKSRLNEICDDGKSKAVMTNVFLGLTLAAAAASGFFYYKAYMGKKEAASPSPDADDGSTATQETTAVRWMVAPTAGPDGGGLGFLMEF